MHDHIRKAFVLQLKNKKSLLLVRNRIITRHRDKLKQEIEDLKRQKEELELDLMLIKAMQVPN